MCEKTGDFGDTVTLSVIRHVRGHLAQSSEITNRVASATVKRNLIKIHVQEMAGNSVKELL